MAFVKYGKDGVVLIDGILAGTLTGWNLQVSRHVIEDNHMEEFWRKYLPSIRLFGISIDGMFDLSDPGQRLAFDKIMSPTHSGNFDSLILYLSDIEGTYEYFVTRGVANTLMVQAVTQDVIRFSMRVIQGAPLVHYINCTQAIIQVEHNAESPKIKCAQAIVQVEHS